jgi:hypothetical protein
MSIMSQPKFLGFASVEGLAFQVPPGGRVCVSLLTTTGGAPIGSAKKTLNVQADLGHAIGYVQIVIAEVTTINGVIQPSELEAKCLRRGDSAKAAVLQWLSARGYKTVDASFARPKDYVYVEGRADFLILDRETDQYTVGWTDRNGTGPDPRD